ncbi:MAG TPA: hypothetical protein VGX00_05070 [Thermoplasmata archaeon]|nr:hypothetical protein [Thermoplasmata archaeon]
MRRAIPRSTVRRAILSLSAVLVAEIVGTIGFHLIEGFRWVDAFYFESMLATGQGPPLLLTTDTGKVFAAVMGFVSVGSVLSAFLFTVGPLVARMWREAIEAAEGEARVIGRDTRLWVHRLEHEIAREPDPSEAERAPPPPRLD